MERLKEMSHLRMSLAAEIEYNEGEGAYRSSVCSSFYISTQQPDYSLSGFNRRSQGRGQTIGEGNDIFVLIRRVENLFNVGFLCTFCFMEKSQDFNKATVAWNSSKAYIGGERVSYNGAVCEAKWWTKGETPSQAGVWKKVQ
ncbi:carbohydrate-binding protein [Paenibacillus sp. FSL R5-808]|jgi:hypothetical protein|nr:carbohydrate-binding protein [Paenibacillus sp. FSL R5-808]